MTCLTSIMMSQHGHIVRKTGHTSSDLLPLYPANLSLSTWPCQGFRMHDDVCFHVWRAWFKGLSLIKYQQAVVHEHALGIASNFFLWANVPLLGFYGTKLGNELMGRHGQWISHYLAIFFVCWFIERLAVIDVQTRLRWAIKTVGFVTGPNWPWIKEHRAVWVPAISG